MAASLPLVLTKALENLPVVMNSQEILYNCPGHEGTAIRKDKLANLIAGISVLIRTTCLQHGGLFCLITKNWARPLTVVEFSRLSGFSERTGARVIDYLVKMGWATSRQIKRKNPRTGQMEVSAGIRSFTRKFWEALRLWEMFKAASEWAKNNARRAFLLPFKAISVKARAVATKVGDLVKPFLARLDDAARVKFHCNQIRKTIRQNK